MWPGASRTVVRLHRAVDTKGVPTSKNTLRCWSCRRGGEDSGLSDVTVLTVYLMSVDDVAEREQIQWEQKWSQNGPLGCSKVNQVKHGHHGNKASLVGWVRADHNMHVSMCVETTSLRLACWYANIRLRESNPPLYIWCLFLMMFSVWLPELIWPDVRTQSLALITFSSSPFSLFVFIPFFLSVSLIAFLPFSFVS